MSCSAALIQGRAALQSRKGWLHSQRPTLRHPQQCVSWLRNDALKEQQDTLEWGSRVVGSKRFDGSAHHDGHGYLCEGSGVCNFFALRPDIELVLPVGQVRILPRALAGTEDRCRVLLVPRCQSALKADAARTTASCAEGECHCPARSTACKSAFRTLEEIVASDTVDCYMLTRETGLLTRANCASSPEFEAVGLA